MNQGNNSSGWVFPTFIVVILIALAGGFIGSSYFELMKKYNSAVSAMETYQKASNEAVKKAELAAQERDAAKAAEESLNKKSNDAETRASAAEAEIAKLQTTINALNQQLDSLKNQMQQQRMQSEKDRGTIQVLEGKLQGVSYPKSSTASNNISVAPSSDNAGILNLIKANNLPIPGSLASLFVIGIGTGLGTGSYWMVKKLNHQGKITVQMTREQLHDYISYQRTLHGNLKAD